MLLEEESSGSSPAQSVRVFITVRVWAKTWNYRLCWLGVARTPPRHEAGRMACLPCCTLLARERHSWATRGESASKATRWRWSCGGDRGLKPS